MQSGPMWAGTLGQCLGAGRSFAEILRQVFSGVALSPERMVRSLDGDKLETVWQSLMHLPTQACVHILVTHCSAPLHQC